MLALKNGKEVFKVLMVFEDMKSLHLASNWLQESHTILVVAGAGMSYGLDLNENEGWGERGPPSSQSRGMDWLRGYRNFESMWGTEAPRLLRTIRYWTKMHHTGYAALRELIHEKDYFIFTSNVDHRFHTSGFMSEKIYTPQGDLTLLQCSTPCCSHLWEAEPILAPLVETPGIVDAQNGYISTEHIPMCPHCKEAPAYKHTRHNHVFTHGAHDEPQQRMMDWITNKGPEGLLVIEIGCGFQTPVVCRFPAEAITRQIPNARLIRISASRTDAATPPDLVQTNKAVSIVGKAEDVLVALRDIAFHRGEIIGAGVLSEVSPSVTPAASRGRNNGNAFAPTEVPWKKWLLQLRDSR